MLKSPKESGGVSRSNLLASELNLEGCFMREKLVAFIKYVGAVVVGAVLSWFGLGCVIARSAST